MLMMGTMPQMVKTGISKEGNFTIHDKEIDLIIDNVEYQNCEFRKMFFLRIY